MDPDSEGNRIELSPELLHEAETRGLILEPLTETVEEITLTGPWVKWFLGALRIYSEKVFPEGWKHKRWVRLSAQGVRILRASRDVTAQELLRAGLATAQVKEKEGK
jgi:hypothetical protein